LALRDFQTTQTSISNFSCHQTPLQKSSSKNNSIRSSSFV